MMAFLRAPMPLREEIELPSTSALSLYYDVQPR